MPEKPANSPQGRPRAYPEDERYLMVRYNPEERELWEKMQKALGGIKLAPLARMLLNQEAKRLGLK